MPTRRPGAAPQIKVVVPPAPIEPMLAKSVDALPPEGAYLFEPKWDGFRAIVFRPASGEIAIQSRDLRPLDRYFPELDEALVALLPDGCIVDGEIVVVSADRLDFDAFRAPPQRRRAWPSSRRDAGVRRFRPAAAAARASSIPQEERRSALEQLRAAARSSARSGRRRRAAWLRSSRAPASTASSPSGATLNTSPANGRCERSSTCAAPTASSPAAGQGSGAGARSSARPAQLYDDAGVLHHVGVTSSLRWTCRRLAQGRAAARRPHGPSVARLGGSERRPICRAAPRWREQPLELAKFFVAAASAGASAGRYDHLQGDRFRHATTFLRWRPDKPAEACRYDQLEVVPPYELKRIFRI
jgi:hypothetical protein